MTSLIPKLALLLHSEPHNPAQGPLVLSLHQIIQQGDQPMLDAGRLLSHDEAQEIAGSIQHPTVDGAQSRIAFLPPVLLRQTPGSLTWYRPPGKAQMYWRTKTSESISAVLPGLLFHVRDRTLHVAAFDGQSPPAEPTKLFHAPLGNVFKDTSVCVGNAALPTTMLPCDIAAWERVLLGTNFSHINHPQTLRDGATTEQLIAFWKRRARFKSPPAAKLMTSLGVTAGEWVRRLEDRS